MLSCVLQQTSIRLRWQQMQPAWREWNEGNKAVGCLDGWRVGSSHRLCCRGLARSSSGNSECGFLRCLGRIGEDFCELEVDQAETTVATVVGDVAAFGIEVANAVLVFEFGEQLGNSSARDAGGGLAAGGGDEVGLLGVFFEQTRDIWAAALFEHFEDSDLGGVALVGIAATETFVDVAGPIEADEGADAVFKIFHSGNSQAEQGAGNGEKYDHPSDVNNGGDGGGGNHGRVELGLARGEGEQRAEKGR